MCIGNVREYEVQGLFPLHLSQWRSALVVQRFCKRLHWDVVGLRTTASVWNVPETYEKDPFALTKAVRSKPLVPAETPRVCVLFGLHLMAAESASVKRQRVT